MSTIAPPTAKQKSPFLQAVAGQGVILVIALVLVFWPSTAINWWNDNWFFELGLGSVVAIIMYFFLYLLLIVSLNFTDTFHQLVRAIRPMLTSFSQPQLVLLAVLAGTSEELLFRGVFLYWLTIGIESGVALLGIELTKLIMLSEGVSVSLLSIMSGIFLSSLLFGLAHPISKVYILLTSLIGVVLGVIYVSINSMLVVIAAHSIYDYLAFYVLTKRPDWLKIGERLENAG
ncbi:CPBP family intramembrane glutamic endopeptidase [Flocculibacter collagenilyticus]|uniref:CPBP family intramembrane glutamic endopeptidase n=1 Tax=Flocculibacter collagenilyticus TaxID=2744479 RepID=UPI0018F37D8D|nr:CPBP family intramembrane glutamic endopeptidase [Flocculibacter collagenilyticus]